MPKAFVGIGSNVNPEKNIFSGIHQLSEVGFILATSNIYESKAFGFDGSNFYNLAVLLETEQSAYNLSQLIREIENRHGRLRDGPRFSSRTLDLDLLIYDDLIQHDNELDIPREDILKHAFVLKPLVDIAGELIHPELKLKLSDIWASFNQDDQELWPAKFDLIS